MNMISSVNYSIHRITFKIENYIEINFLMQTQCPLNPKSLRNHFSDAKLRRTLMQHKHKINTKCLPRDTALIHHQESLSG